MPFSDDVPDLAALRLKTTRRKAGRTIPRHLEPPGKAQPSLFQLSEEPRASRPVAPVKLTLPTLADVAPRASNFSLAPSATLPPPPQRVEAAPALPRVWSVAGLVRELRGLVERSYGHITVEGEISNWRLAGSGHCYFTLKDGDAQIAVVLFRRSAMLLRFKPKDGDAVRLRGQATIYESRGNVQVIAESMELAGQGALLAAVQQLKERLQAEGLFERKRSLPAFPKCIGVITSLQGAALRDIVKVCRRRHAAVNLLVYPASVQGPRCVPEVIAGLRWFNNHPGHADVVVVARGGGSWEDLHGFDDEGVVRAIVGCTLPVISGIGHATDTTIADAAADVCAPTPSAAAELVTAAQHRVEERVDRLQARVLRAGRFEMLRARQRLTSAGVESGLRSVRDHSRQLVQRMDELAFRLEGAGLRHTERRHERLSVLQTRLARRSVARRLQEDQQQLQRLTFRLQTAGRNMTGPAGRVTAHCESRLSALSPLKVLARGYALVYGEGGELLRSAAEVRGGDKITARLAAGSLRAVVAEN